MSRAGEVIETVAVLVVGCGNPLRGDDGAGWHVARRLSTDRSGLPATAEVRTCHQLTPELAEDVARASLVVLVDASAETPPGTVSVARVGPGGAPGWSHHLDPPALLALADRLYATTPPMFVVSVGGAGFDATEALSPAVEAALPAAVEAVVDLASSARRPGPAFRPSP